MEPQKDIKAMAPSYTPKNVKDLKVGDRVKVSGTETYRSITAVHPSSTPSGNYVWVHFDELVVRRLANATVKVMNQQ